MKFWSELWSEYRELAKALVGTILELAGILIVVYLGHMFISFLGIKPSCNKDNLIECAHTFVLIAAWVALLGSFIVVAAIFAYRHTVKRVKDIQIMTEVQHSREYSTAIVSAFTSMESTATGLDRIRAIQKLKEIRQKNPFSREITIFLGRLNRYMGDLDAAIACLSEFLTEKQNVGQSGDKDYADVLYNRACYFALNAAKLGKTQAAEVEQMKERAYNDLMDSVTISPENKTDVKDDPDFDSLKSEGRFQTIIQQ